MNREIDKNISSFLSGCRRKDRQSQNALYKLYYAYGMSISIRYIGTEHDAIIVLNDGFLKVFNNLKKYDASKPFKPWFRKIIVNTALNQIKKNKKYKNEVSMNEAKYIEDSNDVLSKVAYQDLIAMVQSLSTAYRTVFNMFVIDGYKHDEIAKVLGISVSTSKSNLSRARANLRDLITNKLDTSHV